MKIYAVQNQAEDSWGNATDGWDLVALYADEKKAKERSTNEQIDLALSYVSFGDCDDHSKGPDALIAAIERGNEDGGKELRVKMAKPGADFFKEVLALAKRMSDKGDYEGPMKTSRVKEMTVEE